MNINAPTWGGRLSIRLLREERTGGDRRSRGLQNFAPRPAAIGRKTAMPEIHGHPRIYACGAEGKLSARAAQENLALEFGHQPLGVAAIDHAQFGRVEHLAGD